MDNEKLSFFIKDNQYHFFINKTIVTKHMGEILIELSEITMKQFLDISKKNPNYDKDITLYDEDTHNKELTDYANYFFDKILKIYSIPAAMIIQLFIRSLVISYIKDKKKFIDNATAILYTEFITHLGAVNKVLEKYDIKTLYTDGSPPLDKLSEINNKDIIDKITEKFPATEINTIGKFFDFFILDVYMQDFYIISNIVEACIPQNDIEKSKELLKRLFDDKAKYQDISVKIMLIDGEFTQIYQTDEYYSYIIFEVYSIFDKEILIKKCANCGKYFIPLNRSDTIYCDRISPKDSTLTCKEYGSQKLWYDKLKQDKTAKLYRNIYMAKQMLVKRNPDIKKYNDDFEDFKIQSKQWKKDVKDGSKTESEYVKWLKSVKGKRDFDDGND